MSRTTRMTMWGPLQAKEMGLDGWEVQDGGETGFVIHNPGVHLSMGRATSTLIFVRRLERAYLTVYLGGYPTDAPAQQRRLDMQKAVSACEMFLGRLSRQPVQFRLEAELALVDNSESARVVEARARADAAGSQGTLTARSAQASAASGLGPGHSIGGGVRGPIAGEREGRKGKGKVYEA